MNNLCTFSPDRVYRYSLHHIIDDVPRNHRAFMWIGLNPSTADENKLDPTLRRIRAFTKANGGDEFLMLNLFAFRSTSPFVMKAHGDPVGSENDQEIWTTALYGSAKIICCWGQHGRHLGRDLDVKRILRGQELYCLGINANGTPKHPLYLKSDTEIIPFR